MQVTLVVAPKSPIDRQARCACTALRWSLAAVLAGAVAGALIAGYLGPCRRPRARRTPTSTPDERIAPAILDARRRDRGAGASPRPRKRWQLASSRSGAARLRLGGGRHDPRDRFRRQSRPACRPHRSSRSSERYVLFEHRGRPGDERGQPDRRVGEPARIAGSSGLYARRLPLDANFAMDREPARSPGPGWPGPAGPGRSPRFAPPAGSSARLGQLRRLLFARA